MTPLVQIMLYGWLAISFVIFRELRNFRGVMCCFIAGILFLPEYVFQFGGIPDYTKSSAICYGVMAAAILTDIRGVLSFRFQWFDIAMIVFCLVPIPTALANSMLIMDGVNASIELVFNWGIPYLVGRMFLSSFEAHRHAVTSIFIGGLIYIPFCIYEIRMSPVLNEMVYGFRYGGWSAIRFGGYRPNVFLQTGLQLGLWMSAACLCGFTVLRFRLARRIFGIRPLPLFLALLATSVMCKATGALALLAVGMALVYIWQKTRWRIPILLLGVFPLFYMTVRITDVYDFSHVEQFAAQTVGAERAQSFRFRIDNEDVLIDKALLSPVLGWGGEGRNRVYDDTGKDISITDGYWVIVLGKYGLVGLAALYATITIVPMLCIIRFSRKRYRAADVGPLIALSVFTIMLMVDCLLNSFSTVVYPLCLGGLGTMLAAPDSKLIIIPDEFDEHGTKESNLPRRRLWPPRIFENQQTAVAEDNNDQQLETAAAAQILPAVDADTTEDESTFNETR